jgi:hypothetical protein
MLPAFLEYQLRSCASLGFSTAGLHIGHLGVKCESLYSRCHRDLRSLMDVLKLSIVMNNSIRNSPFAWTTSLPEDFVRILFRNLRVMITPNTCAGDLLHHCRGMALFSFWMIGGAMSVVWLVGPSTQDEQLSVPPRLFSSLRSSPLWGASGRQRQVSPLFTHRGPPFYYGAVPRNQPRIHSFIWSSDLSSFIYRF